MYDGLCWLLARTTTPGPASKGAWQIMIGSVGAVGTRPQVPPAGTQSDELVQSWRGPIGVVGHGPAWHAVVALMVPQQIWPVVQSAEPVQLSADSPASSNAASTPPSDGLSAGASMPPSTMKEDGGADRVLHAAVRDTPNPGKSARARATRRTCAALMSLFTEGSGGIQGSDLATPSTTVATAHRNASTPNNETPWAARALPSATRSARAPIVWCNTISKSAKRSFAPNQR
jgi:hypothetical protein